MGDFEALAEAFKRNRAAPVADNVAMLHLFCWWERHRDDYTKDTDATYVAKEFASTIGSLFATIESLRASLTRVEEERDEAVRLFEPILVAADLADGSDIWKDDKVWGLRGVQLGSLRKMAALKARLSRASPTETERSE